MTTTNQNITMYEGETKTVTVTVLGEDLTAGAHTLEFLATQIAADSAVLSGADTVITYTVPGTATGNRGRRGVTVQAAYLDGSALSILTDGTLTIRRRA